MKLPMSDHNQKGVLITFCGLDGCGKTTQITLLKTFLTNLEIPIKVTKQPTDFIRNLKMFRAFQDESENTSYDYRAVSLFCAADRIQHSNRVILPLLSNGSTVISDRYFYSCLANLHARGYTEDKWIADVSRYIPKPDYAFFLDIDVDIAINRVRQRPEEKERYIDKDFQIRLREQYLKIAHDNNGILIDSGKSPEETFIQIRSELLKQDENINI